MTTTADRLAPLPRKDSQRLGQQLARGVHDAERFERYLVAAEQRLAARAASTRASFQASCTWWARSSMPSGRVNNDALGRPGGTDPRCRRRASTAGVGRLTVRPLPAFGSVMRAPPEPGHGASPRSTASSTATTS